MALMAKFEEKHTLSAVNKTTYDAEMVERRKNFREKLLERIREQIGTGNIDQIIREQILLDICAKITAVYVGCFETVEQYLGEDVWAYKMKPEKFDQLPIEDQNRYSFLSGIWEECKNEVRHLGNNVIVDIIYILSQVDFVQRDGIDIIAQARLREKLRTQRLQESQATQATNQ